MSTDLNNILARLERIEGALRSLKAWQCAITGHWYTGATGRMRLAGAPAYAGPDHRTGDPAPALEFHEQSLGTYVPEEDWEEYIHSAASQAWGSDWVSVCGYSQAQAVVHCIAGRRLTPARIQWITERCDQLGVPVPRRLVL